MEAEGFFPLLQDKAVLQLSRSTALPKPVGLCIVTLPPLTLSQLLREKSHQGKYWRTEIARWSAVVGRKLVIFPPAGSKTVIPGAVVCYIQNRVQEPSE